MADDSESLDGEERVKQAARDFQERVPDTALWYDSDVLGKFPEGWGLTVMVSGRFITGRVATVEQWVSAMQKHAGVPESHPVSLGVEWARRGLLETREQREKVEKLLDEDGDVKLTVEQRIDLLGHSGHLHMIDARALYEGVFVPTDGAPMRIRYSEIQAWTHGIMGTGPRQ